MGDCHHIQLLIKLNNIIIINTQTEVEILDNMDTMDTENLEVYIWEVDIQVEILILEQEVDIMGDGDFLV